MSLSLQNKTILVTRATQQSGTFHQLLEAKGAKVIDIPALTIGPPSSWAALDQAIAEIALFQWLILTSANGVKYFLERINHHKKDVQALSGLKIAVVGAKTANTLEQYGLKPDFVPPEFVADMIVQYFPERLTGKRILFPRVESGGREILVQALSAQGADVVEVAAYQSGCPAELDPAAWEALKTQQVQIITFASSKTVRHFAQLLQGVIAPDSGLTLTQLLAPVKIASIGPQTSQTCQEILGRVDVEAQEYTLEGLADALCQL